MTSLADVIAFNEREAAVEMPWFGQELFQAERDGGRFGSAISQSARGSGGSPLRRESTRRSPRDGSTRWSRSPGGPAWVSDLVYGDNWSVSCSSRPSAIRISERERARRFRRRPAGRRVVRRRCVAGRARARHRACLRTGTCRANRQLTGLPWTRSRSRRPLPPHLRSGGGVFQLVAQRRGAGSCRRWSSAARCGTRRRFGTL